MPGAPPRGGGGASGAATAEAARARVRAYHATEPSVEAMRQRQVWVEPLGAETRAWHGQRRSRPRGLPKAIGEALLVAAGQNRERRPSTRGWGRRPRPGGAAGLALPAPTAPAALQ